MNIWSFVNCPTVICSPTICYFSREKPLVKPTAPGSLSRIFAFAIYFFLAFIIKSIKPKIPCCNLYYLAFDLSISTTLSPVTRRFWHRYSKGIDNPFNMSGCEVLLFVCRWCLRGVRRFSYWYDSLGLITEGNTYRHYTTSSLPLWGNTGIVQANI